MTRPFVIVESPFAAAEGRTLDEHVLYLRLCLRDSWTRGELPFASHAFFPLFLSESTERKEGIEAGYEFWDHRFLPNGGYSRVLPLITLYTDLGISPGMWEAMKRAQRLGRPYEVRTLKLTNERPEPTRPTTE